MKLIKNHLLPPSLSFGIAGLSYAWVPLPVFFGLIISAPKVSNMLLYAG